MDERKGMVVKWQSMEYKGCVVNPATPIKSITFSILSRLFLLFRGPLWACQWLMPDQVCVEATPARYGFAVGFVVLWINAGLWYCGSTLRVSSEIDTMSCDTLRCKQYL